MLNSIPLFCMMRFAVRDFILVKLGLHPLSVTSQHGNFAFEAKDHCGTVRERSLFATMQMMPQSFGTKDHFTIFSESQPLAAIQMPYSHLGKARTLEWIVREHLYAKDHYEMMIESSRFRRYKCQRYFLKNITLESENFAPFFLVPFYLSNAGYFSPMYFFQRDS